MEYKILTFNDKNEQCWTNPPTRDIDEVWAFIEDVFKGEYIKSFRFINENKKFYNPKQPQQKELF